MLSCLRNLAASVAAIGFMFSTPAFALIDAQLLIGSRSGDFKADGDGEKVEMSGNEVQIAAHVDPIPLVPVAFGVYLLSVNLDDIKLDTWKKVTGFEAGLQLYAWFPIGIANLKPYAKLGLPVYSDIKADLSMQVDVLGETTTMDGSAEMETSGVHMNFGLSWNPLPLVSVLAEASISKQKLSSKNTKLGDQKLANTKGDYNSTAYLLGVQVGI